MLDAIYQFRSTMRGHGLNPPETITPGKITAFPGLGKSKGNTAARCFIFPDRLGGWFMDYSTGLFEVWQAKREKPYTQDERQAFKDQCERDRKAREQEISKAISNLPTKPLKSGNVPFMPIPATFYLHLKKAQPHGTKTGDSGGLKGVLIAPLYDENIKLVNLQFIQADGTKRFLTGGKKSGCFWWLGQKTPPC